MNPLVLAWRQLRRDFTSGDVRILFVALVLAVVAITSVGCVTDRGFAPCVFGARCRFVPRAGA